MPDAGIDRIIAPTITVTHIKWFDFIFAPPFIPQFSFLAVKLSAAAEGTIRENTEFLFLQAV
jgi:hypothetical protein